MVTILCAKEGSQFTVYIDEDEWPDIKTWWTRSEGDQHYHATGSDGEDVILDREFIVTVLHYPPALWEEKQKAERAKKIRAKKQQGAPLTDEERQILRDLRGGGKSGPQGLVT